VTPTYEVKLVSLEHPVRFRPYLVKEEKLLLTAQQSEDPQEIERAIKQIVRNCTSDAVDVEKLPLFDLEYLFLQLRAKSVNNVVKLRYECQNAVTGPGHAADGLCHAPVEIDVNLDDVKITVPNGHTNRIMLNDDVGVTLKYPRFAHLDALSSTSGNADAVQVLIDCLDTVFSADGTVTEIADVPPADVRTFVESLQLPQVEKLKAFFETLPRLSHTLTFTCPSCGYTEDIVLTGLLDFFG
jgi:hypothetical protein